MVAPDQRTPDRTNKQTTKTYVNSGKQDFNSIMVDAIPIHAIHFRESKFLFGSRCCRGTSSQESQMPLFTYLVDIIWWKWTTIEVSCFICECQLWVKWYPQDNDSRMQVQNVPCKRQYYFQNNSETFLQQRRFTCPRFKTEPLGISKIANFCFLCWFVCSFVYFLFFCEI